MGTRLLRGLFTIFDDEGISFIILDDQVGSEPGL